MTADKKVKVLLVDDHMVVRLGIMAVLDKHPDIRVVAQADDADSAVAQYRRHLPDVVLMDLRIPGGGIEALQEIRRGHDAARVVIFSTFDFEDEVHRAMRAGAAGYLLKSIKPRDLVASVLQLHKEGRLPLAPSLATALAEREKAPDLTLREREVLGLIAKGLTNKDIARVLGFSTRTAKAHVTSLLVKLDVADRNEATSAAFKRGIVPLE